MEVDEEMPASTDSTCSNSYLDCSICGQQYGFSRSRWLQHAPQPWSALTNSDPADIAHDGIDVVPSIRFNRGHVFFGTTAIIDDPEFDLCDDISRPHKDHLERNTNVDYDLAGREVAHSFKDLRSAGKVRRRHRNELDKYYSYRSQQGGVNRGMVGQECRQTSRGRYLLGDLMPGDAKTVCMTKGMLYQQAQTYPRPPKHHRRNKHEYTGGKTAKWEKRNYDKRRCRGEIDADVEDSWGYRSAEFHAFKQVQSDWRDNWEFTRGSFLEYEVPPQSCALEDLISDEDYAAFCNSVQDGSEAQLLEQDIDWTLVNLCCSSESADPPDGSEEWSLLDRDNGSDGRSLDAASQWSIVDR